MFKDDVSVFFFSSAISFMAGSKDQDTNELLAGKCFSFTVKRATGQHSWASSLSKIAASSYSYQRKF
jgi:hypothetical protein